MKIIPNDESVDRLVDQISRGKLKLQPDFQRGEVWSSEKKKLLIDSILRGWHVPPVHIIKMSGGFSEVLDGQQRLTAISDFVNGKFYVNGAIAPRDEDIEALHGLKYYQLPQEVKDEFDDYIIRVYRINEFNQGEPGELFHRLNQAVKLTSSEQRNAFYGEVRDQVAELVEAMGELGLDKSCLGFSNSRMAYNDLITRVCHYIESGSIRTPVSDRVLNQRFRDINGFSNEVIQSVAYALELLSVAVHNAYDEGFTFSLTKASSLSWLYFIAYEKFNGSVGEKFESSVESAFVALESTRGAVKNNEPHDLEFSFLTIDGSSIRELMLLYIERCSSRVTALSSILIRDFIISVFFSGNGGELQNLSSVDEESLYGFMDSKWAIGETKSEIETVVDTWRGADNESC